LKKHNFIIAAFLIPSLVIFPIKHIEASVTEAKTLELSKVINEVAAGEDTGEQTTEQNTSEVLPADNIQEQNEVPEPAKLNFSELRIGEVLKVGSFELKKIESKKAIVKIDIDNIKNLDASLDATTKEITQNLNQEVLVEPLSFNEVNDVKALVVTNLSIPFVYVDRSNNSIQFTSEGKGVSFKVTLK
jgi:hypothetical protein